MKIITDWIQQIPNKKRILWLIGDFILGLLIGYGLGLLRVHTRITHGFQIGQFRDWWTKASSFFVEFLWSPLANWFNTFTPSVGFVSDVIAYQAAIIAIAIPVGLEIISRISERYQSGVITKEFNRQWQFKALLPLVIAETLLGITMKFFVGEKVDGYWKVLAWLIFLLFFATNFVLLAFFKNLRQYTTDTKFLLDRLFDDLTQVIQGIQGIAAKKQISDQKLKEEQEKFINALEGIGDILVFETKKRKSSQYIIDSLRKIQEISQNSFTLQQSHPEQFSKLLFSHKLLELNETNQFEASTLLEFFPKDYSVALMAIVNQFLRIREAALEIQNLVIAGLATDKLNLLLQYLSQVENNNESIKTLLRVLEDLRYANQQSHPDLAYTLSVSWYTSIVFQDAFILGYLESFDHYFVPCIREIISSGKTQLFEGLVQTLHDSIHIRRHSYSSVEEFHYFLSDLGRKSCIEAKQNEQLNQKLSELTYLSKQLQIKKQLQKCLALLKEIMDITHHFTSANQGEVQIRRRKICNSLESQFKFNHLIDLMFDAGAYCIFKQRYDYLYKMWKYRQPDDADDNWLGHDIIPTSLPALFNFYFRTGRPTIPWENHHGSSRYYDQYFLILLLREFLNPKVSTNQDRQNLINGFQLPVGLDSYHLHNIQHKVNRLIPLASKLNDLSDSLNRLGLDTNQLSDAIHQGVIPFLESLKPKAEEQLEQLVRNQRISPAKVEAFKAEFLEGYDKLVCVRELFKFLELYSDKTNETENVNLAKFGLSETLEKAMLFEEWYADYGHLGLDYGQNYARDEDSELIVRIMQTCGVTESHSLENFLDTFGGNLDNLIIIRVNLQFYNLFDSPDKFKPKSVEGVLEIDLPGFLGSYIYKDHMIPVFEYFCQIPDDAGVPKKAILLLDKTHLGNLVQYAPATADEPYQREKHFAFRVQAFAEDEMLISEFLKQPPDWILEEGDEAKQRAFLESQVLVQIYEKFDLQIDPKFVGFISTSFD